MGLVLSKLSGAKGYLNYGRGFDSDAVTFLTATGITNIVQQKAINELVIDLKGYGIWTKQKALYPVVGGTSARHAVNLRTPGTYNLSFTAGWVHSNTGMTPNGTSDYANTFVNPRIVTPTTNHLSFYSRTNNTSNIQVEIGIYDFDISTNYINHIRPAVNYVAGSSSTFTTYTTTNNSLGFWIGTKRGNSDREVYLNGSSQTTLTTTDAGLMPNANLYIGARNEPSSTPNINYFSVKQCAFASIGDGLTDTEAANFYTAVQKFQTTLGRQV